MSKPPDAVQRESAIDPDRSFIVQAPAGSGKTELLIQRYLRLLGRVEQPESVVAITFTHKAAGEMRRRVLNALRDAAGPRPEKEHSALTWELARAVRARSEAAKWGLFENPSRLRIRTIDSLCAYLCSQMPWMSRLGAHPEVLEDAGELYSEAARRTIEMLEGGRWSSQVETLLVHLDNDYRKLQKLIASMLARRDQWLRHVLRDDDPAAAREALEAALRNAIRDAIARAAELTPAGLESEIVAVTAAAGAHLLAVGRDGRACDCVGLATLPGADALAPWLGIADTLLTDKGEWRKTVRVTEGFPPSDKSLKKRWESIAGKLAGEEDFRRALGDLRCLPGQHYAEEQWNTLEALIELLPAAAAQLKLEFRERGAADFAEVAMAAQQALGTPQEPTDLAISLDCSIRHLLVDEFQDTSVSQYSLLERLTAGWESGDGRTIFVVGDPMQSIYRFREAAVGLFLKTSREGIGNVKLEPLALSANFRSDQGVVRWVNSTFPLVLPGEPDVTTGAIPFCPSDAMHPAALDPAVRMHPFLQDDSEAEASLVVRLAQEARARRAGTTAILVRARSHLESILPALRRAGLRFRAIEIERLDAAPVIQDLTALTRALLHPGDRVAWLAVLRAPWCGLSLKALHELAADSWDNAIWDLIRDEPHVCRLEPEEQAQLARTRAVLEQAFAARPGNLRLWIEGAWMALGGPACARGRTDLENAAVFLDLIEELDQGGAIDLDRLETRLAKLYARPDVEADDSLQLMTIHQAKGLEFDTVIIPGLGRKSRADELALMQWLERPRLGATPDLLIAPIHATGADSDPVYEYLKRVEAKKAEHETGRLLYVAATRAKTELHLVGHVPAKFEQGAAVLGRPDSSSLLRAMWQVAAPAFEEAASRATEPDAPEGEQPTRSPQSIRRLVFDWSLPAPPESVRVSVPADVTAPAADGVSFHWVGNTLRHVGTVVHQMLRRLGEDGVENWTTARVQGMSGTYRSALVALGVSEAELADAVDRVSAALTATIADAQGRWILSCNDAAACEVPICGVINGQTLSFRIDRMFLDAEGTRWIVDYKTSSHQGSGLDAFLDNESARYSDQMLTYRRLFEALEDRPVRTALYFPLLQAWREVQAGASTEQRR